LDKIGTDACRKLPGIILIAIILLSMSLVNVNQATAQTDQATSKLQAANMAVDQAFIAVLDAEKTGANVTELLSQLNYAQDVLARAENSYRVGDLNRAGIQADNVLPIAQQVTSKAQNARLSATVNELNAFHATIAFTVIGCVVFVLVLFMVWRLFKRRYIKNMLEAKPGLVHE
jgi:hypothetical protein